MSFRDIEELLHFNRDKSPNTFAKHDKHQIVFHITRNHQSRRLSALSIIRDLQLNIHPNTLKHTLKDLGYNHCIARRRPFLKKVDRKRHLQFANRHAHLTIEDWKAYIWTDEMSIKVGMERSTQDWVWRRTDEEFHPDCINVVSWEMDQGAKCTTKFATLRFMTLSQLNNDLY